MHVPPKIQALTRVKQVRSVTIADKVNTNYDSCLYYWFCSPMLICPIVNFRNFLIHRTTEGSLGTANMSGLPNEITFLIFTRHLINYVRSTKECAAIVLMQNHESHISVPKIRLAKENNIVLVTLHWPNKMQSLDKSVFAPLKTYFIHAANEKMMTPGNKKKPLDDSILQMR